MKNYREFINVSIFRGNSIVFSVDCDNVNFDTDGRVWLYKDGVIIAHFAKHQFDNAYIADKWLAVYDTETVYHVDYVLVV